MKDEGQTKKHRYTNYQVDGLDKRTYRDSIFLGNIYDHRNEPCELYVAYKGKQQYYVVVGFKKPVSKLPTKTIQIIDERSADRRIENITFPVGKREIKAELPKSRFARRDANKVVTDIMHDRSIEYADRLLIAEYNVREDAKVKAKVLEKRRANK